MRRQKQSKSREKRSIERTETEYMSGQKRSIEPTETDYRAGRNRIWRHEGEISRCIEYTGWLYIAEKEQTSRDFHKKM